MNDIASSLPLGVAYVAAPGPIIIETLRQGVKGRLTASLAVQVGSALGPTIYGLLALFGVRYFMQGAPWQTAAGLGGMAILIYLRARVLSWLCGLALIGFGFQLGIVSARHLLAQ